MPALLQPIPFTCDLGKGVADLTSVDADVLEFPIIELTQRDQGRLALVMRD